MNVKHVFTADAMLLCITFVWGTTFVIVQDVLEKVPPLTFNAWRFLIAAILLGCWRLAVSQGRRINRDGMLSLLISGFFLGTLLFAGYACQTIGLLYTSASSAAFITGLSVVLVPVLSSLLLKKPPSAAAIVGIICAAVGLFLLTTRGRFTLNKGDLIVLVCAAAFALHIVFTAKAAGKFSSLSLTIVQLTVVAVYSFAAGYATDGIQIIEFRLLLQPDVVVVILFMACFATAIAFLLQTALQKFTPPTHVGIIYIMEPVFAAWTSLLVQHIHLGAAELAGCALILAGMLFAEWPSGKRRMKA